MSQVTTQPRVPIPAQPDPTRAAWIGALLALTAAVAAALVIAVGGDSDSPAVDAPVLPALRADGGPDESRVAAALGSRPASAPSESAVAAAIGAGAQQSVARPSESGVAAAVGAGSQEPVARPDESRVAAAVSAR